MQGGSHWRARAPSSLKDGAATKVLETSKAGQHGPLETIGEGGETNWVNPNDV